MATLDLSVEFFERIIAARRIEGMYELVIPFCSGQPKAAASFYDSNAYLRDPEQPGIMKTLLTGLFDVEFRLSYNSRYLLVSDTILQSFRRDFKK